ncbi:MAG: DUF885 domain-containing protein [Bacteroidota bacterium]|nr:DUF885 domain-containing protein [Bacteroidota bacterium]MDW8138248.1 DUF885 domain-containing protein [Bacteroidota bacterium]
MVIWVFLAWLIGGSSDPLRALLDSVWAFRLREDPLLATYQGFELGADRLPSRRPEDLARYARALDRFWAQLSLIDRAQLAAEERLAYDVLRHWLENERAEHRFGAYRIPITSDDGFHIAFTRLPQWTPFRREQDYIWYLARLRAFPDWVRQHIALMREGIARGQTLPAAILEGYEVTIEGLLRPEPEQTVFFAPFRRFPAAVPPERQEALRTEARRVIRDSVQYGYRLFLEFFTREYRPKARRTIGISSVPGGREYYAHLVRYYTTLPLSPEEVHRIGLEEVRRIRAEMDSVMRQTGFKGTFAEFLEFLRTDPRFYARTPEELLKEAAWIAKQMDGRLPRLFHVRSLPRLPYGVAPVPEHLAPRYTGGRYVPAPTEGTEGGYYWVNPYPLNGRPLYVLEALTLHEAVPGHHLQYALRQELTQVHPFVRSISFSAFGEGWALYAERLGKEVGFYADPYREFGRLTYEMWRACRLVVDTGLHAMGWSREQAIAFLAEHTALSRHEVQTEVDRYIAWPGQALAYKIGELKIRELRRRAEAALGPRFDVRDFHDVVLRGGSIPLPTLEERVETWIQQTRSR